MNEKMELLKKILYGSKEFKFSGSILELRHYYTGDKIKLDLSVLLDNEEVLEEMIVDDDDDYEY